MSCEYCGKALAKEKKRRGPPRRYHDKCLHEKHRLMCADQYKENRKKRLKYARAAYKKNPKLFNSRSARYYEENREKVLKQQRKRR